MKKFMELQAILNKLPAGSIPAGMRDKVLELVEDCWDKFEGSSKTKMEVWKIGRDDGPEDLTWEPPNLLFTIDRHGGAVMGSNSCRTANMDAELGNDDRLSRCKRVSAAPAKFAEVGCNSYCKGRLRSRATGTGLDLGVD